MTMWTLVLLAALEGRASCKTDAQGYCAEKIVRHAIRYEGTKVAINCAVGEVVSLALPEGVELRGPPALGNKVLFEVKVQREPLQILVWPKVPAGATTARLEGARTNLQVVLDSNVRILVDLKIAPPNRAVQSLVFTFPEREAESAFVRAKVEALSRALEEEYQEKTQALDATVETRARRRLAHAVLERIHCADVDERAMKELLVVRADQICRLGDLTFVIFSVKNRARDLFRLHAVTLSVAGAEEGEGAIDIALETSGEPALTFDQSFRGVAVFSVAESAAKTYALTVQEDGGKKRVVTVDDVAF